MNGFDNFLNKNLDLLKSLFYGSGVEHLIEFEDFAMEVYIEVLE